MTKRFRQKSLPSKLEKYIYISDGLKSKDYKEIQKSWKVYLSFNSNDLEEYKRKNDKRKRTSLLGFNGKFAL